MLLLLSLALLYVFGCSEALTEQKEEVLAFQEECPLFRHYDNSSMKCVCQDTHIAFDCNTSHLEVGACMTYDKHTDTYSTGICPFDLKIDQKRITFDIAPFKLTVSVSSPEELNNAMCDVLNRKGLLCASCKSGYGLALYSNKWECVKCGKSSKWFWVLYVALEIIPVTAFFVIIIFFNIRATLPPFTAYIFLCQLVTLFSTSSHYKIMLKLYGENTLLRMTLTVLGIWNLDFFRDVIPPFCVDSSFHKIPPLQELRLAFLFYPLLLITLTYFCIKCHNKNCRVIVTLWKPFHMYFARYRRSWDPESSVINAFSTFMLLSFLKIILVAITLLYPTSLQQSSSGPSTVMYLNPYMHTGSKEYWWRTSILVTLLIGTLLPLLLLCLHPTRCFRKATCNLGNNETFKVLIATFQGYYKDGSGETRDYRAVSSLPFLLRMIMCAALLPHNHRNGHVSEIAYMEFLICTLIIISLFYAIAQPCRKRYMNNIESVLYALSAILVLVLALANQVPKGPIVGVNMLLLLALLPSVILFMGFFHQLLIKTSGRYRKFIASLKSPPSQNSQEEIPYRALYPNECTPLIHSTTVEQIN